MKKCNIPGCKNQARLSKDGKPTAYCSHACAQKAYIGKQKAKPAPTLSEYKNELEKRFWPRINKNGPIPVYRPDLGPCWLWKGSISQGYGQTSIKHRLLYTHRVMYELEIGPIPDDYEIDHLCRVRSCINPKHLEAVTPLENLKRQAAAYRSPKTCKHGHPFIPENRRPTNNGRSTYCLLCRKERDRKNESSTTTCD